MSMSFCEHFSVLSVCVCVCQILSYCCSFLFLDEYGNIQYGRLALFLFSSYLCDIFLVHFFVLNLCHCCCRTDKTSYTLSVSLFILYSLSLSQWAKHKQMILTANICLFVIVFFLLLFVESICALARVFLCFCCSVPRVHT